ncbi:hypothetical protein TNCV_1818061 [Trichonephila clavipes]|nr:hypothetical protein TNCV_1818061 [Trichonephila clavipes]
MFSRVSAITPSQVKLTMTVVAETQQTDQELHTLIASGTSLNSKDVPSLPKSKIHRHTKITLSSFQEPSQRFDSCSSDLIGPLPLSNGYTYCLIEH